MKTIEVDTNLHCSSCVARLTPHLDGDKQIDSWSVNMDGDVKRLSVSGEDISVDDVAAILSKEGYQILEEGKATQADQKVNWRNKKNWNRASFNTLNCLIGCSIGDFGMIIYLQAFYPSTSMLWQMLLAIVAGLTTSIMLETALLKYRENFSWTLALQTAFGMSFISMVGMEIAMNTTDFMVTGGKAAFDDPVYWTALLIAMVAGFVAPLPYNYYKLEKYNKACH